MATFSDINLDIALGMPIEVMASNKA